MSIWLGIFGGALAGLLILAPQGHGHTLPLPPPMSPDTVRLGMDEAELRARAGDAFQPGLLSRKGVPSPGSGLAAFHRRFPPTADLAYAEYELYQGKTYRIRWRLAEHFERPLFPGIADRMTHRLGPPLYDQIVEPRMSSRQASLRRAAWRWSGGTIEVRQLQPKSGGPLFLTWVDKDAVESMLDAGLQVPPQPDQLPPWWEGRPALPRPLAEGEEEPLLNSFESLLASWLQPS
ncbi:MAG TPA: hypothetical protein VLQ45_08550 [Thermoanaerobaculia bacterium]|nr:hypothetical protein [Thermoanaerobaculia bacterium]